jgi:hypothetical protein
MTRAELVDAVRVARVAADDALAYARELSATRPAGGARNTPRIAGSGGPETRDTTHQKP